MRRFHDKPAYDCCRDALGGELRAARSVEERNFAKIEESESSVIP